MADLNDNLTQQGFNRPEIDDIANWIKQLFKDQFGSSIDMDDTSTAGMWAGVLSSTSNKILQVLEGAVNQCYVLSASGTGLDDQGAEWGLQRKQATHSFVELDLTTYVDSDSPTIIPAGSLFSTADGHQFETLDDVTISKQANDDNNKPLTDQDGNALGTAQVQAVSVNAGVDENVTANSIINPVQAIDGFYSVTNPLGAQGGSEAEGDTPFRIRIYNYRTAGPKFTDNGITAELRNIPDVKDTKLVDNNTMNTDKYGNPAKSIHLYVLGGDDQDVANKYFSCLYPTTHTVGSITENVTSDDGISHQVSFDHAKPVPVYIHYKLTVDPTKFNQDQAISDIQNNVMQYFDNLKMGETVLYSRLFGPAYQEDGVKDARVELGTNQNNLSTNDVSVNDFELAQTSPDDIQIDINEGGQNV